MTGNGFTWIDLIVIAVIVASTGFAVWRGFIRETLSIVSWAAAAFATLYFGPLASSMLREMMSQYLAVLVGYVGVFLLVLVPMEFLTFRFSESVHNSPVGALDRSLGLVFGIVRGLAIVGFAYLIFTLIVPIRDQPAAVRNASTLPIMQNAADVLLTVMPGHRAHRKSRDAQATRRTVAPEPQAQPSAKASRSKKKTYGAKDRRALDRLIQATGSGGQ